MAADGPVILIRPKTSPEDVAGMSVAVGILTGSGGLVSHAAVVARGWGIPAVVGAADLYFHSDHVTVGPDCPSVRPGQDITIDGSTGQVWAGRVVETDHVVGNEQTLLATQLPELAVLEKWATEPTTDPGTPDVRFTDRRRTTMKVVVDRAKCTGPGVCEAMAPTVFEVGDDGQLVVLAEFVEGDVLDEVQTAIDGCPTEALMLVDG